MATKDRTALKDEFKNGNLATGERFTDLIDSMKVVQEPVADPAASGTSLSFIDSISQDADGKITPTKKTLDLANAHELNPFKGWYKTGDTLPTTGFDGAYLYFKDTSELTGQTTIYRWNGTAYADTGTVVDTSNVQTFETGQAVNGVAIDGTGLANPLPNAIAKATDVGAFVGNKLAKVVDEVTVSTNERLARTTGAEIASDGTIDTGLANTNVVDKYGLDGVVYVKVTGYKRSSNTTGLLYAFYDSNDTFIRGYKGTTGANVDVYDADIPINASYVLIGGNTTSQGQNVILKEGVISKIQVEDTLESTSSEAALSANQGRLLDEKINQMAEAGGTTNYPATVIDKTTGTMDASGATVEGTGSNYVATFGLPDSVTKIKITGYKTSGNTTGLMYVFCDVNGNVISGSGATVGTGLQTVTLNAVPSGAKSVKVMGYKLSTEYTNIARVVVSTVYDMDRYKVIEPELEYGRLSAGSISELNGSSYPRNIRTCKYIKVYPGSKLVFKTTCDCYMTINRYTKDYQFIDYAEAVAMTADVEQEINIGDASLIKCNFAKASSSDTNNLMPQMSLFIKGIIPDNWDIKNDNRTNEYGVIRIRPIVEMLDPDSCNGVTNNVQDSLTRKTDYVLLMLPKSYSNTGKPTRLIIYCHGAGVTYGSSTVQFPDTDYRPAYWLSEGYALMDCNAAIQSSSPHWIDPGALQAYITAYRTVVRNYNICTDGIFLGGRSMGGGMSIAISQCKEIPVIANCPVSPVLNTLWWWNYGGATRRANLAADMGFVDYPTGVTATRITDAEWAAMKANSDIMRKYSPLWTCIDDLPTDNAVLYNDDFKSFSNSEVSAEMALYGSLHIKLPPTKIFHNDHDGSVPYQRNGKPFYKAMVNGGTICEVRLFDTTNDEDATMNEHHAELRSDRILATYTNSRGEVIENVPVAYIEMLMFWQRYEGSVI